MADFNDFSVGKDCSLVVTHPLAPGGRLDLSIVTDFDCKPTYRQSESDALDGKYRSKHRVRFWEGSFTIDRATVAADAFSAALDKADDTTGSVPSGTVHQYVTEADGSQTTFQFSEAAMWLDDAGSWKGEGPVKQKLMFRANRREIVS